MKKAMLFKLSLLFAAALCLLHSYAQDSPQWGLPEGAKAHLGKGSISKIQYSPDGTRLAVASSIGIWLYDTVSNQEASLFAGPTSVVSVAFSPDGGTIAGGYEDASILLWDAPIQENNCKRSRDIRMRSIAWRSVPMVAPSPAGVGTIPSDYGTSIRENTGERLTGIGITSGASRTVPMAAPSLVGVGTIPSVCGTRVVNTCELS